MNSDQNNALLTAINAVMVSFTQQVVEQATKPLIDRIRQLELDVEALNRRIQFSLQENANTSVNIAMAAVKQEITKQVLDLVDERIKTPIASITADDISGLDDAIEEALQNQPPLNAEDINGLDALVRSEIDEQVDTDTMEADLIRRVRAALREAADSL